MNINHVVSLVFQGIRLHPNPTAGIVVSDHSLVLQGITRKSAGNYTCQAANTEGPSTSNIVHLEVMCECEQSLDHRWSNALKNDVNNSFNYFYITTHILYWHDRQLHRYAREWWWIPGIVGNHITRHRHLSTYRNSCTVPLNTKRSVWRARSRQVQPRWPFAGHSTAAATLTKFRPRSLATTVPSVGSTTLPPPIWITEPSVAGQAIESANLNSHAFIKLSQLVLHQFTSPYIISIWN